MITVPGNRPAPVEQDNSPGPTQAQLLMAAAQMHQMGRLAPEPRASDDPVAADSYKAINRLADPAKFNAAVQTMPQSKNIEDRRESDSDEVLREFTEMKKKHKR